MSGSSSLEIAGVGLVTSVGMSAAASCAAIRSKLTHPAATHFAGSDDDWIIGHLVTLERPWTGRTKLVKMAGLAIEEALDGVSREQWAAIPLVLCVAEADRPGRLNGLEAEVAAEIRDEVRTQFSIDIVAMGRVGVAVALRRARELIYAQGRPCVVIAATDSYLHWPTLSAMETQDRLLNAGNADGFIPGEAAGAVLVTRPSSSPGFLCTGLGFSTEPAPIRSGEPLRADGLTFAIRAAVADAGCTIADMDYRLSDMSGEQYYFKEATIALTRTLRERKERFDIWHPAECTGEIGAVAGVCVLAVAEAAARKGYADGRVALAHFSNDNGHRAALTLRAPSRP